MNKKGDLAESIKSIGGIVLGIAALLLVLYILNLVFGAFFFKSGPDQETKQSFENLEEAIRELNGKGDFLFRFSKGYSMVVFDGKIGNLGSGNLGWYTRPSSCFDDACIVLCKDDDKKDSCLDSKYIIKLDKDEFITDNDRGIVYPLKIGNSRDELLLLVFEDVEGKLKINLVG